MKDPFFEKTVVLIWHHDEEGAIGVVVNRLLEPEHELPSVLTVPEEHEGLDLSAYEGVAVGWGGPVETDSGTVVTRGSVDDDEGWQLPGGIGVTRSLDALVRLIKASEPIHLVLGYAGWGPRQLDQEIEKGGWLSTDCDPQILFETPISERYNRALLTLGLSEHLVWMQPINE
jgi:putative transcriptional regulator